MKVSKGYQWGSRITVNEPHSNVRFVGSAPVERRHTVPMCRYRPERRVSCVNDDFINRRNYTVHHGGGQRPRWIRDLDNFVEIHCGIIGPLAIGLTFFTMVALWLWLT